MKALYTFFIPQSMTVQSFAGNVSMFSIVYEDVLRTLCFENKSSVCFFVWRTIYCGMYLGFVFIQFGLQSCFYSLQAWTLKGWRWIVFVKTIFSLILMNSKKNVFFSLKEKVLEIQLYKAKQIEYFKNLHIRKRYSIFTFGEADHTSPCLKSIA